MGKSLSAHTGVARIQLHKKADQTVWSISTSTKSGKKLHKSSRDRRFMQFSLWKSPEPLFPAREARRLVKNKGLCKAKQDEGLLISS